MGKQVVMLSNSGKSALANIRRLAKMGIEETAYTDLITSGEVVRDLLRRRDRLPYSGSWDRSACSGAAMTGQPSLTV